jgi:hypothetical protein
MVARRIIFSFLAFAFLSVTAIPIVHADGTAPGGVGDRNIHPWDNNDDYVVSDDPFLVFRRPIIWIAEVYTGRGLVTWSTYSASRYLRTLDSGSKIDRARGARKVTRLEAGLQ